MRQRISAFLRFPLVKTLLIACALSLVGAAGQAQQIPIGAHYGARGADSGFGSGSVTPTGSYATSVPIAVPRARSGLPVPVDLRYTGGSHVGEGSVG
jgi:hypothetical protein